MRMFVVIMLRNRSMLLVRNITFLDIVSMLSTEILTARDSAWIKTAVTNHQQRSKYRVLASSNLHAYCIRRQMNDK